MKTVKEVSRITGVSVRTLHHYDAIGLLKPTAVTEAGYRLYDDAALERMQSILFFRELQFPLKDIKRILDAPDFDPMTALAQQVHLLEMQRKLARENNVVMDGRDIGTVVLPDATVKIFLTASVEERAMRRFRELEQRGTSQPYDQVLREIVDRDYADTHRAIAPLRRAEDAVELDTGALTFEESLNLLLETIRRRAKL
mgnify:CR=1 FL=1